MFARTLRLGCLAALVLCSASPFVAADDEEPNNNADWLTWTLKDCKGDTIDLSDHQNKTVYVVVFTPGSSDSCSMMRDVATYIRAHTNKADKVLGFCSDDTGCDAIKLHIQQEEWKKRVDAWNAEQVAAKAAAAAGGAKYEAPAMPDYLKQIKDEMNNATDFNTLIAYHLPFTTCQRCPEMWSWLLTRMTAPEGAPRLLKINPQGHLVNQWSSLPNPLSVD